MEALGWNDVVTHSYPRRAQILAKNVGNKRNLAIARTATTVFLENEREGKYYLTMAGWKSRKGLSQHLEE